MTAEEKSDRMRPESSWDCFKNAPVATAMVDEATHAICYANPAFCRLIDVPLTQLISKPLFEAVAPNAECLALLNLVCRTGKSETHTDRQPSGLGTAARAYTMWPVITYSRILGVMVQVTETSALYETTVEMNEALILGSLRQQQLTADATLLNAQLQVEIGKREQREHDAHMLKDEVAHRIKNNLQIVVGLIAQEAKWAAAPCVQNLKMMQGRIQAIAGLYDLIARSGRDETIAVGEYLTEIGSALSASLLGNASKIKIVVEAEALEIDPNHAVPFGLLVNELATNAIKHAFPNGTGLVLLSVRQTGEQIQLEVADNGVGIEDKGAAEASNKHGANYVAMFVRQLGGTLALLPNNGLGTTIQVQFPSLVVARDAPSGPILGPGSRATGDQPAKSSAGVQTS